MASSQTETRQKDGRAWRIGNDGEVAWIANGTEDGVRITSAIPPIFEAYATVLRPGIVEEGGAQMSHATPEQERRHEAATLTILQSITAAQSWWLGFLETGVSDVIFDDAPKVKLYAGWPYVLVEAGPEQARTWRKPDVFDGSLPDLMFPADRTWLLSTLWDDCWACVGGPRTLIDRFLSDPALGDLTREVDPSMSDATPPDYTAW